MKVSPSDFVPRYLLRGGHEDELANLFCILDNRAIAEKSTLLIGQIHDNQNLFNLVKQWEVLRYLTTRRVYESSVVEELPAKCKTTAFFDQVSIAELLQDLARGTVNVDEEDITFPIDVCTSGQPSESQGFVPLQRCLSRFATGTQQSWGGGCRDYIVYIVAPARTRSN